MELVKHDVDNRWVLKLVAGETAQLVVNGQPVGQEVTVDNGREALLTLKVEETDAP